METFTTGVKAMDAQQSSGAKLTNFVLQQSRSFH